jgi:hypothetical protein
VESRINHPEDYLSTSSSDDDDDNAEDDYARLLIEEKEDNYNMKYSEFNELGVGLGQVGVEMSELGVGLVELEGLEVDEYDDELEN